MTTTGTQFNVRRGDARGRTDLGWLHSRHSFSFGRSYDPRNLGYRALRVINDDIVEPGGGFGAHDHDTMEILTWVLAGGLRHQDSTGQSGVIRPGDLQVMSAGRGIRHSEMNASDQEPVHFLQVWIEPAARDIEPAYTQKTFPPSGRRGRWQPLASHDGRSGSLRIHQDVTLSVAELGPGEEVSLAIASGRHGYLHVATGAVRAGEQALRAGDAITSDGPVALRLEGIEPSQVLLFDLA